MIEVLPERGLEGLLGLLPLCVRLLIDLSAERSFDP